MTTPDMGHNALNSGQLKSIIDRVERLDEELKAINADKAEVYREAKGNGYCTKTLKKIIAIRRQDQHERAEQDALLETYLKAIGVLP